MAISDFITLLFAFDCHKSWFWLWCKPRSKTFYIRYCVFDVLLQSTSRYLVYNGQFMDQTTLASDSISHIQIRGKPKSASNFQSKAPKIFLKFLLCHLIESSNTVTVKLNFFEANAGRKLLIKLLKALKIVPYWA